MQAQVLAVISVVPSALIDGMIMFKLMQGDMTKAQVCTGVISVTHSVLYCAVFIFIFIEAMEAHRKLRLASNLREQQKYSAHWMV